MNNTVSNANNNIRCHDTSNSALLPMLVFSTEKYPKGKQFRHFRKMSASIANIRIEASAETGFQTVIRGHNLGQMKFVELKTDSFSYELNTTQARSSGSGQLYLSFRKKGFEMSRSGDRVLAEPAGTLVLKSLDTISSGTCSETEALLVFFRRERFPDLYELVSQAGHILITGNLSEVIKMQMVAINSHLPQMTHEDAPLATKLLSSLISGAIDTEFSADDPQSDTHDARLLAMAMSYIQANLKSHDLSPTSVSSAIGISRRKLYYLFESAGGVAKFVRSQRLAACHAAIEDIADHRRISSVAYEFGFQSPSQFSRQFRHEFGYSPRDVLNEAIPDVNINKKISRDFLEWLDQ